MTVIIAACDVPSRVAKILTGIFPERRSMTTLAIQTASRPLDATILLPGSKSLTNRALLIAALAEGTSIIRRALFSDDTRAMHGSLTALGIAVEADEANQMYTVHGARGTIPASSATLFVGNAGTAARFLTAAVALGHGRYVVDGVPRMRQRPIQPLIDGLRQLGVDARAEFDNGCPPVIVQGTGLPGGTARVRGDISSQYFSALMLAAPHALNDVEVQVEGTLVSVPYVEMTAGIMAEFGVHVDVHGESGFRVPAGQKYQARDYVVEPDASGASYFFAAAAVTGGHVRVPFLGPRSPQGDLGLLEVLERMGCRVQREAEAIDLWGPKTLLGVDADFERMGDVFSTLAAIAPFASGPVRISGIAQTHHEESDRPVAVATELRRMGIRVEDNYDSLVIHPGLPQPAEIQTYDDHRIAMSFAITGLRAPGIVIAEPGCVAKTFPEFFEVLTTAVV
ncbi:MAG: 3-phosphoshikimate 1-carboxyvinyltransferase [Chloroflexota bacterium]